MVVLRTGPRPSLAAAALAAATLPAATLPKTTAPIVDLRPRLPWQRRLPGRLGTAALWLGSCSLLGPAKLIGLLLAGSLLGPCLLLLERSRPAAASGQPPAAPALSTSLPRAALAAQLGLPEHQLFRARHAAICTVHHDADGRIVELELPAAVPPLSLPSPDAHPVG